MYKLKKITWIDWARVIRVIAILAILVLGWILVGACLWTNSPKSTSEVQESLTLDVKSDAIEAYNIGTGLLQKGQFGEAIISFNNALELNPDLSDAMYNRGLARYGSGDFEGAVSDFSKLLLMETDTYLKSQAYWARAGTQVAQNNYALAMADYNSAIELDEENDSAYLGRGSLRAIQGDYEGAIEDFERAIELAPMASDTYIQLANAHYLLGESQKAISVLGKAIVKFPLEPRVYIERGRLRFVESDDDLAIQDLDQAIELSSDFSTPYYIRGMINWSQDKLAEAYSDFEHVIELNGAENPSLLLAVGDRFYGDDELDRALEAYEAYVNADITEEERQAAESVLKDIKAKRK